ncbi:hypothetical protein ACRW9N_13330 [Listeria aquatica]|uniref:hypothetical protein n=1 Tax=Listeria aquatica TaxID=1494960 RepID=UPI000F089EC2
MKKHEIEQKFEKLAEEIKSTQKLLLNIEDMIADKVDFKKRLESYMLDLFYAQTGSYPDEIFLTGKITGNRYELHVKLN